MTPVEEANLHLAKAKEFLEAAETTLEMELFSAATSSAVTSGINSKDAVCLRLTGHTEKSDNHVKAAVQRAAKMLAAAREIVSS
jgi:uncharacterized protein (UPF0332 family)